MTGAFPPYRTRLARASGRSRRRGAPAALTGASCHPRWARTGPARH